MRCRIVQERQANCKRPRSRPSPWIGERRELNQYEFFSRSIYFARGPNTSSKFSAGYGTKSQPCSAVTSTETTSAPRFSISKVKKPARGTDFQNALTGESDFAQIVIHSAPQIPLPSH